MFDQKSTPSQRRAFLFELVQRGTDDDVSSGDDVIKSSKYLM